MPTSHSSGFSGTSSVVVNVTNSTKKNVTENITSVVSVPIVPVQPVQKINVSDQVDRPSPFVSNVIKINNTINNNTGQKVDVVVSTLDAKGKSLLIQSILLGAVAVVLGGLLFFSIVKRNNDEGKNENL